MKRNWFQFRLRTLFVLVTLAALVTGMIQHARYFRERIRFHESKRVTCEERLVIAKIMNTWTLGSSSSQPEYGPKEAERVHKAIGDGYLLYVPEIGRENDFVGEEGLVGEHEREIARLEQTQRYHQQRAESFRLAMWRPWMRVGEDPGQELPDEPPEAAPAPSVATPSESPQSATTEVSVPKMPPMLHKPRLPWQSIERPLPHDFNKRHMQVEKVADA
jgi:hypothetical protein